MLFRGANNYNETLNIAARRGHESIARLMIARGATVSIAFGCAVIGCFVCYVNKHRPTKISGVNWQVAFCKIMAHS